MGGEPLGVGVLGGAWAPGSRCSPAHGHLAVWCRVRGATPGGLPLRPSVSAGVRIWEILEFGLDFQALDQRRVLGQSLVPPPRGSREAEAAQRGRWPLFPAGASAPHSACQTGLAALFCCYFSYLGK